MHKIFHILCVGKIGKDWEIFYFFINSFISCFFHNITAKFRLEKNHSTKKSPYRHKPCRQRLFQTQLSGSFLIFPAFRGYFFGVGAIFSMNTSLWDKSVWGIATSLISTNLPPSFFSAPFACSASAAASGPLSAASLPPTLIKGRQYSIVKWM